MRRPRNGESGFASRVRSAELAQGQGAVDGGYLRLRCLLIGAAAGSHGHGGLRRFSRRDGRGGVFLVLVLDSLNRVRRLGRCSGLQSRSPYFSGVRDCGGFGEGGCFAEVSIAFEPMARALGEEVRAAALDHEAFARPMRVCELGKCRATCCHDGVFLDATERRVLEGVVEEQREALARMGWREEGFLEEQNGRCKTRSVAAHDEELAEAFPAHFPRTRCVFLDEQHRCVLQRLAVGAGRHPWFWKPVSCWMHPLLLKRRGDGRPWLTLARPGNDPAAKAGYPGFGSCTPCGMEVPGGEPGWKVLGGELELLGELAGRDLVGELAAG